MRLPKIKGSCMGVSVIRITVVWGSILGPLIYGNYHICRDMSDK